MIDVAVAAEQPQQPTKTTSWFAGMGTLTILMSLAFYFLFSYGAAKLSYDKYRSIGWAILDFFFSSFYYPYYALVLNTPSAVIVGARRLR